MSMDMRDFLTEFVNRKADEGVRKIPGNFRKLTREARAYLAAVQGRGGLAARMEAVRGFELDMEHGVLRLDLPEGTQQVATQVVGTYADDGSFMWGWGHPSVPVPLQQAAWAVQRYGDRQMIDDLLSRGGETGPDQVGDYLAIAAYLSHADGVFMGDHGGGGQVCAVWFLPATRPAG